MSQNNTPEKRLFIDSNCWFRPKIEFYSAIDQGFSLCINPTIIYEVIKVIDREIHLAIEKKRNKRVKVMQNLKQRLPNLFDEIQIEIIDDNVTKKDLKELYLFMDAYEIDIGDALILLNLQKNQIKTIMTNDLDWKRIPFINLFGKS